MIALYAGKCYYLDIYNSRLYNLNSIRFALKEISDFSTCEKGGDDRSDILTGRTIEKD